MASPISWTMPSRRCWTTETVMRSGFTSVIYLRRSSRYTPGDGSEERLGERCNADSEVAHGGVADGCTPTKRRSASRPGRIVHDRIGAEHAGLECRPNLSLVLVGDPSRTALIL